jgi:hypothetical protein
MSGETTYEDEQKFYDENPNLPLARLEWEKLPDGRIVGSVNGHGVYTVRLAGALGEFQIFHRLPVKQIDRTFKASDEAKLFADTHLHRAMRVLGFVAR